MAGVAPQRGGSNASTIGMVVSIIVAAALAVVAVIMFTNQESLRTATAEATAAKTKLAKGNDESVARQLVPDAGAAGKSVVGELNRALQMASGRLSGNQNDPPSVALTKLDGALKKIIEAGKIDSPDKISPALGAVGIIENLHEMYAGEKDARQKAEAAQEKALADLKGAIDRNEEIDKELRDQLAAINAKVDELQNAKSEYEKTKSGEVEKLAAQIGEKRDELDTMRRDTASMRRRLIEELSHREALLDEQKAALASLRGPGAEGAQELAVARNPVGSILRALPGDSLVHIDLGRRDRVVLGLTFAVYSGVARVPSDGRGKGLVEVVSVGERTSECRVISVPSPDDPILEGDKVGNIVLSRDRSKKQRFVVIGKFDIDFDGTPDLRGADSIKALIRRFGGEIVDRVDASTDYVVLGTEPSPPEDTLLASAASEETESGEAEESAASDSSDEGSGDSADSAEESDDDSADADESNEESADSEESSAEDDVTDDEASGADEATEDKPAPSPTPAPSAVPTIAKSPEVDVTKDVRTRKAMSERELYDEAVRRAEKLSIPRLPLERFLNFVGLESGPIALRQFDQ
ncbi:hypothetical protein RAS2_19540 [Phycisphaerae bacterium RAS2]|nr:hypothetical protein RAS2_19540 [Phycisphaerae bacterium RAS2]